VTIGARVLKTGLAVAVALWIGELFGVSNSLIGAIAAIFTIQPSIYRSWIQVVDQIQSMLLGAAMGLGAVYLIGASPISVGLVCVCAILICMRIGSEDVIGLTLVTVVIIMEAGGQGWQIAVERLGGIMTGIASAFLVNVTVAPPRHARRFVKSVEDLQRIMSRLLRTAISNEIKESVFRDDYETLRTRLRKLEESFKMFAEERVWRKRTRMNRARLLVVYKGMLEALEQGTALIQAVEHHYFSVNPPERFRLQADQKIEALCGYHEQIMWKWAGHIKPNAHAAAPPPEDTDHLADLIPDEPGAGDPAARSRMLAVVAAIFSYEDRLRRLDKLMEHYLQRGESEEAPAPGSSSGAGAE
jgi:uncharacterized membrane protein YgaE (UPF0421/DUF939 family)